jgi:hypothetical protein
VDIHQWREEKLARLKEFEAQLEEVMVQLEQTSGSAEPLAQTEHAGRRASGQGTSSKSEDPPNNKGHNPKPAADIRQILEDQIASLLQECRPIFEGLILLEKRVKGLPGKAES